MYVLHSLFALLLLVIPPVVIIRLLLTEQYDEDRDRLVPIGVGLGFVWLGALFSGFFQLGSRNAINSVFLWKMGCTAGGGLVGIFSIYAYVGETWNKAVVISALALSEGGFLASLILVFTLV
ncbi:MAG: hypothetical protein ABEJ65_00065 [bacterium]